MKWKEQTRFLKIRSWHRSFRDGSEAEIEQVDQDRFRWRIVSKREDGRVSVGVAGDASAFDDADRYIREFERCIGKSRIVKCGS